MFTSQHATRRVKSVGVVLAVGLIAAIAAAQAPTPERTFKVDRSGETLDNGTFDNQDHSDTNFQRSTMRIAGFRGAVLQRCSFRGANLYGCSFTGADMTECDMRNTNLTNASLEAANLFKANFAGLNLAGVSLQSAKLVEADLTKTRGYNDVQKADFSGADLRGSDLSTMRDFGSKPNFTDAKYDRQTRWPAGFDAKSVGAVFVPDAPTVNPTVGPTAVPNTVPAVGPKPMPTIPMPNVSAPAPDYAAEFFKLDLNQDEFLSGKEAKSLDGYDLDGDREITLKEFIAGRMKSAKP